MLEMSLKSSKAKNIKYFVTYHNLSLKPLIKLPRLLTILESSRDLIKGVVLVEIFKKIDFFFHFGLCLVYLESRNSIFSHTV